MNINGYTIMADSVTKFHNLLRIYGWFHHSEDALVSVRLVNADLISEKIRVGFCHEGVLALGDDKGFEIQALRHVDDIGEKVNIEFITKSGSILTVAINDLCRDRIGSYPTHHMSRRFINYVNQNGYSVLDIGGRARSKVDRRKEFTVADYVVLDLLPGDNVDVVGDAHALGMLFEPDRFDAFYSVSVFEHLMMPWAVVSQINKVLKTGAIGLIHTHQTLGMHDRPWDFWRFSDAAWDALFNHETGFEIVDRCLDSEQYILPFIYTPSKRHAERSAGFEGSAVWVKKIGPCKLNWDVVPGDLVKTYYPDLDDDFNPEQF
jgi:hypothetical protein